MSKLYPRIRIQAEDGFMWIREGLSFNFYMRRFHQELLPGLLRSLETYQRAVGPDALGTYWDEEGEALELDAEGWERTMRDLTESRRLITHLGDGDHKEHRYAFNYFGKKPNLPSLKYSPDWVSGVSFWLPTEYLEEHGPERTRALALAMAEPLPFCSGHAGLSFNAFTDIFSREDEVRGLCFRYPGIGISELDYLTWHIGTRIRGVAWLNFLGQPVLGELGGVEGLRSRLHSPGTTVEALDGERVVVTLGEQPDAGDTEEGRHLPAYREFARILEPWLYHEKNERSDFIPEDILRWERRFLD